MGHSKTVFLIDDDMDDQEIFGSAIEMTGESISCVFADDGINALDKMETDKDFVPDYIFIDMNMPRMNGQECLAKLRQIERLKNVPVYIYSTSADPVSVESTRKLGAVDYIIKPSDIHLLSEMLRQIIKKPVAALMMICMCLGLVQTSHAQNRVPSMADLKRLTVEELMNIEVSSVSKSMQKLSEVASAIQVLRGDEIRRSSSTLLPEILRMASNLQVSRSTAHDWGISARGFNSAPVSGTSIANKLLVMIDGRTVYNPLFGGVYWDVQGVIKEDLDQIEIVSGPGGTLWGDNAVNGVINVISKNARETQGLYASAAGGSFLRDAFQLRYGGQRDSAFYYRVYAQRLDINSTVEPEGFIGDNDRWDFTQAGFRTDYMPNHKSTLTFHGDMYFGDVDDEDTKMNGQSIIGRWNYDISEKQNITIQSYYDRTWRQTKAGIKDHINTFDFDLQHSFYIGGRNKILWGAGYRVQGDIISNNDGFSPSNRILQYYSAFIQDQVTIIPEKLELTLGTKFTRTDYTGFEWQPSGRIAYTPNEEHTVWAAVSRAVRTPTRFDRDITVFKQNNYPEFKSEKVLAYELGYRTRPMDNLSISFAGFYNDYNDVRSFNATGNPSAPIYFGNDLDAKTYGFEMTATYVPFDWWRVRAGYTMLYKEFTETGANLIPNSALFEGLDPNHQVTMYSSMDIPGGFQLDITGRFVDALPEEALLTFSPYIPPYINIDVRAAWQHKFLTLSLIGMNLISTRREFGAREIPRSVQGKVEIRL